MAGANMGKSVKLLSPSIVLYCSTIICRNKIESTRNTIYIYTYFYPSWIEVLNKKNNIEKQQTNKQLEVQKCFS